MIVIVHLVALLMCALSCCLMTAQRFVPGVVAAAVMLASMCDVTVGARVLPGIAWTAVLLATSIAVAIHDRRHADANWSPRRRFHGLQASLGLFAMATVMPFAHGSAAATGSHGGHAGVALLPIPVVVVVGFAVFSAVGVARLARSAPRIVEVTAMTLSLGAMAFGVILQHPTPLE